VGYILPVAACMRTSPRHSKKRYVSVVNYNLGGIFERGYLIGTLTEMTNR